MNFAIPESQRDSVLQPRVGASASLPWEMRFIFPQPQRGCVLPRAPIRRNRVAVGNDFDSFPRVVAPRQPWAELRYPVGVRRTTTLAAEKATLQNAVTATDQQIDALVYDLYGLTEEEIKLVAGGQ